MYEYDPRDYLWKCKKEVKVLEKTMKSIKIREHWWSRPKWYPLKGIIIRFDIIDE